MKRRVWFGTAATAVCIVALLGGCGGGGGGGGPVVVGPAALTITSSDPADGAKDVALNKALSVTFSGLLDASTVGASTFRLSSDQSQIDGSLSINGATVTLTTTQRLVQATRYKLDIGGLRGALGAAFPGATLSFTTCDRAWQAPQAVSPMSSPVASVQHDLAVDSRGNATLVWTEYLGWWTGGEAWAARYDPVAGKWSAPVSIRPRSPGVQGIDVAMDPQGNAMAVWSEGNGGGQIWANRYVAATGTWSGGIRIDAGSSSSLARGAQVVFDARGNALAVWGNDGVWAARYDVGAGTWMPAVQVQVATAPSHAGDVRLAVDRQGDAVLVWQMEASSGPWSIWYSLYNASANNWAAGQLLTGSSDRAEKPVVAVDRLGNAFAGWQQSSDGIQTTLWFRRYDKATALWSGAVAIGSGGVPQNGQTLTVDGRGNALVAWTQTQTTPRIWATRYDAQAGQWGTPTALMDLDTSGGFPNIASDEQGNAVLVWQQRQMIWFSRYSAAALQWTAPSRVTLDNQMGTPLVAIDGQGNAMSAWLQINSSTAIWSSRLSAGRPEAAARYCDDSMPPG